MAQPYVATYLLQLFNGFFFHMCRDLDLGDTNLSRSLDKTLDQLDNSEILITSNMALKSCGLDTDFDCVYRDLHLLDRYNTKIVAAFQGMHVSPAKHKLWEWDRQTTDKDIAMLHRRRNNFVK